MFYKKYRQLAEVPSFLLKNMVKSSLICIGHSTREPAKLRRRSIWYQVDLWEEKSEKKTQKDLLKFSLSDLL